MGYGELLKELGDKLYNKLCRKDDEFAYKDDCLAVRDAIGKLNKFLEAYKEERVNDAFAVFREANKKSKWGERALNLRSDAFIAALKLKDQDLANNIFEYRPAQERQYLELIMDPEVKFYDDSDMAIREHIMEKFAEKYDPKESKEYLQALNGVYTALKLINNPNKGVIKNPKPNKKTNLEKIANHYVSNHIPTAEIGAFRYTFTFSGRKDLLKHFDNEKMRLKKEAEKEVKELEELERIKDLKRRKGQ